MYNNIVVEMVSIHNNLPSFNVPSSSWLNALLHHSHCLPSVLFPFLPQVSCFLLNISLVSIVFIHLLFHHHVTLFYTYERDYSMSLSLWLTSFSMLLNDRGEERGRERGENRGKWKKEERKWRVEEKKHFTWKFLH